jgi:hypothetical protein
MFGHSEMVHWTPNIREPELSYGERKGKDGTRRVAVLSSSPYLGWLAINLCICIGQLNPEIPCDKHYAVKA